MAQYNCVNAFIIKALSVIGINFRERSYQCCVCRDNVGNEEELLTV